MRFCYGALAYFWGSMTKIDSDHSVQNWRRYWVHETFIFFKNEQSHALNYANSCKFWSTNASIWNRSPLHPYRHSLTPMTLTKPTILVGRRHFGSRSGDSIYQNHSTELTLVNIALHQDPTLSHYMHLTCQKTSVMVHSPTLHILLKPRLHLWWLSPFLNLSDWPLTQMGH